MQKIIVIENHEDLKILEDNNIKYYECKLGSLIEECMDDFLKKSEYIYSDEDIEDVKTQILDWLIDGYDPVFILSDIEMAFERIEPIGEK